MKKPLFLFGTLRHAPLLDVVAGEKVALAVAELADHAVCSVKDQAFPMLCAQEGADAIGFVARGMSDNALNRIDFYESVFAYQRKPVTVMCDGVPVDAEVYVAQDGLWEADGPWDLSNWCGTHGDLNICAAEELMERRDSTPVAELGRLYPFIRARAGAVLRARAERIPLSVRREAKADDIVVTREDTPHDGFFRVKSFGIKVRRFDGAESAELNRETFLAYDAALVLPYDPVRDTVLLVEQFRLAPYWRGDPQPFILEPIAGIVDAGETPAESAVREAVEEAGLKLDRIIAAGGGYAAPGYVTEYHYFFIAPCTLNPDLAGIGGLEAENEDIRSHVLPFETAMAMVESGEINAAPLALLLLKLGLMRDALREKA